MINQRDLIYHEKWRTLFVMDATRFDVFKEICKEEETSHHLIPSYSAGCETSMWINETWDTNKFKDAVLISNSAVWWEPTQRRLLRNFRNTVPLWKQWKDEDDCLPLYWGAVMPTETVLRHAEKQHIVKPKQRLIIHDIPPHLPYCTDEGKRFLSNNTTRHHMVKGLIEYGKKHGWSKPRHHYKESARMTLKTILECKWIQERGGLVITSDHGEMIGEAETYGHSIIHKRNPVLRVVPWMTVK